MGFAAKAEPADYLPGKTELPGWSQQENPGIFTQDTLWDLMDGGAEIYLEYGVEGAASVRYKHSGKGSVLVEIYAMKDAGAAFGIFSLNSRVKGDPVQIGDEALLANDYVLVRKGAHFMTLTVLSDPVATMPACLELARAIAARIPAAAGKPDLLSRLPVLIGASVHDVYFRGSIGLLNLYPLDASDPFKPSEGVAAIAEDAQFFILRQADGKEAAARFDSAWAILSSNPKYKVGEGKLGGRCLIDEKGRRLLFARDGDCNLIAIGTDEAALRGLVQQVLGAKKH
ncbi:MAG: DUF6599 family protein [Opitutaceae bacterium]